MFRTLPTRDFLQYIYIYTHILEGLRDLKLGEPCFSFKLKNYTQLKVSLFVRKICYWTTIENCYAKINMQEHFNKGKA